MGRFLRLQRLLMHAGITREALQVPILGTASQGLLFLLLEFRFRD